MEKSSYLNKIAFFNERSHLDLLDSLTGVIRRGFFLEYVKSLIADKTPFSFYLLDIDNFKGYNDEFGHTKGDEVLINLTKTLKEIIGENGLVGRFGGDEFLIVMFNKITYDEMYDFCHNTIQPIFSKNKESFFFQNHVTVTIGGASFPKDAETYDDIFAMIDKAMYRGKQKGRNCFIIYVKEKHEKLKVFHDKKVSNTQIINRAYKIISTKDSFRDKVDRLYDYLINTFDLSEIDYIDEDRFQLFMNDEDNLNFLNKLDKEGYVAVSNRGNIIDEYPGLFRYLKSVEMRAIVCVRIGNSLNDKKGYLFLKNHASNRVWQMNEIMIFLTVAKFIGLIYNDKFKSKKNK